WSFVLALWVGIWVGTLYVVLVRRRADRPRTQPALASEGVMLWAMVPACLALGFSAVPVGGAATEGSGAVQGDEVARGARFLKATPISFASGVAGSIDARPLIDGDRVYLAVAYPATAFGAPGNLYCVERSSGKVLWDLNSTNRVRMKEVFSSP